MVQQDSSVSGSHLDECSLASFQRENEREPALAVRFYLKGNQRKGSCTHLERIFLVLRPRRYPIDNIYIYIYIGIHIYIYIYTYIHILQVFRFVSGRGAATGWRRAGRRGVPALAEADAWASGPRGLGASEAWVEKEASPYEEVEPY